MCLELFQRREIGLSGIMKKDTVWMKHLKNESGRKNPLGVDGSQRGGNSQHCQNRKDTNHNDIWRRYEHGEKKILAKELHADGPRNIFNLYNIQLTVSRRVQVLQTNLKRLYNIRNETVALGTWAWTEFSQDMRVILIILLSDRTASLTGCITLNIAAWALLHDELDFDLMWVLGRSP